MSAAVLREAAELIRERAEGATPGPWVNHHKDVMGEDEWQPFVAAVYRGQHSTDSNVEHIASWHPLVALAVADWLEAAAVFEQELNGGEGRGPSDPGQRWRPHQFEQAVAVARTYLGGVS